MCVMSITRDVITGLQLRTTWHLLAARGGLSAFRQAAKSQVAPTLQSGSIFGQLIFSLSFQSPNVRERTGSALDVREQMCEPESLSSVAITKENTSGIKARNQENKLNSVWPELPSF